MKKDILHLMGGIFCLSALLATGCKKMVQTDLPFDRITATTVYNSTELSTEAITGLYTKFRDGAPFAMMGTIYSAGGLADETIAGQTATPYTLNQVLVNGDSYWDAYRSFIYPLNSLINGVTAGSIPQQKKNILIGEAKVSRAFIYFYLVNFFGDIPIITGTDFKQNSQVGRDPKEKVYQFIIQDLLDAQDMLSADFLKIDLTTATTERVRPNKATATALLARVYLYHGDWQKAIDAATAVINNPRYQLQSDLNQVFLKNSGEAIWQLQPENQVDGNTSTLDGQVLIPPFPNLVPLNVVSPFLEQAFETGDQRLVKWTATTTVSGTIYRYFYKYKMGSNFTGQPQDQTEYLMVLRLAEQYLIRAEARTKLDNYFGANSAESDINIIRKRAGLGNTTASSTTGIIDAIAQERYVELFTEGAHRWFDLRRTGKINERMAIVTPTKGGGAWEPYKALMPIPASQFLGDPGMHGHQNPGYPEK